MICGRPDLGEKYLAWLVDGRAHGHVGADPIVRVLAVVRYPRQHALYWPEVAIEIPPVEAGCICRLHLYGGARCARAGRGGPRRCRVQVGPHPSGCAAHLLPGEGSGAVCGRLHSGRLNKTPRAPGEGSGAVCGRRGYTALRLYAMSLERAQREALRRETGEAREIVRRQMAGEYRRQRAVLRMTRWEAAKYGA